VWAPLAWFGLVRELAGVWVAVFVFPTKQPVVGQAPAKGLPNVRLEVGLARFDQEEEVASQSPTRYSDQSASQPFVSCEPHQSRKKRLRNKDLIVLSRKAENVHTPFHVRPVPLS
jgi:hypothetical protein